MRELLHVLEWMWNNSTPQITLLAVMILAIFQYFQSKRQAKTANALADHLDHRNRYPHPECEWGEKSYNQLCENLKRQHEENREDHQILFAQLRGENPQNLPERLTNKRN